MLFQARMWYDIVWLGRTGEVVLGKDLERCETRVKSEGVKCEPGSGAVANGQRVG